MAAEVAERSVVERLLPALLAVTCLAGCGVEVSTIHAGAGTPVTTPPSVTVPPTVVCGRGQLPVTSTSTPGAGATLPATTSTTTVVVAAPSTVPELIEPCPSPPIPTTALATTVAPTTIVPTTIVPTTVASTSTAPPPAPTTGTPAPAGCQPSVTLSPPSGGLGTRVTVTARCFPPGTTLTFSVPQSGGLGTHTAISDGHGTATFAFTYSSANGRPGATSDPVMVSVDPNASLGPSCPPTPCALAQFGEH